MLIKIEIVKFQKMCSNINCPRQCRLQKTTTKGSVFANWQLVLLMESTLVIQQFSTKRYSFWCMGRRIFLILAKDKDEAFLLPITSEFVFHFYLDIISGHKLCSSTILIDT